MVYTNAVIGLLCTRWNRGTTHCAQMMYSHVPYNIIIIMIIIIVITHRDLWTLMYYCATLNDDDAIIDHRNFSSIHANV